MNAWVLLGCLALFIFILRGSGRNAVDSSDKGYFNRSGLSVYTDEKTKLQYIGGGYFGGITPRLDVNGKQMRSEE